ncbi:DUF1553 domain-containing protein [Rubinisphaera margarita]|uniref:DUF1553 domain-containing protein n=1 Tax=Rubinisphaera margarita TaxID=2909586 RepID=UPI001EE7A15D|nr:DUF1553 domain-containing protein [Rubinisphaera margarita]MCG6156535.1 DUF1553 domain-containing protein [Rubinisphaera margarita]
MSNFPSVLRAESPALSPEDLAFFEEKIRPVLIEHCYECHSPESKAIKGGLLVHSREALATGGDSGPAVIPGDVDESLLLSAMKFESFEMPPQGKLPEQILNDFETWIKRGAPDPRDGEAPQRHTGIDLDAGREFWAFQPLTTPELPEVSGVEEPVDRFILAKLNEAGLSQNGPADAEVLLRRVYYDLTGLPPSPEQVRTFAADSSPKAYARIVDRLLASREFGERWGRHWLDVARYADSTGGGRSRIYRNSWRYRDYVIDSFQADKPYDQFIREQLAGDLLPYESVEQAAEQLTGCGFLMLGPHNYELQDKALLRMEVVDEQIDTLGKAFLGMTIGCARCHDHKFDPIPAADYYALAGIFRSTKSVGPGNVAEWITQEIPMPPEQQARYDEYRRELNSLEAQLADVTNRLKELNPRADARSISPRLLAGIVNDEPKLIGDWKGSTSNPKYVGQEYVHDQNTAKGANSAVFEVQLAEPGQYEIRVAYSSGSNRTSAAPVTISDQTGELATLTINQKPAPPIDGLFVSLGSFELQSSKAEPVRITVGTAGTSGVVIVDAVQLLSSQLLSERDELQRSSLLNATVDLEAVAEARRLKQKKQELTEQISTLKKDAPPAPEEVMAVREEVPDEIGDTELCIRGNIRNLGPVIPRGVLQVATTGDATIRSSQSGRLELAEWIASPENPLTARVMVNRIWHHLFGAGIVRTVDNFGSTGELPSHPQLLDYLAVDFIRNNWSVKSLIRQIVLSRTYRISGQTESQLKSTIDPENRLLAYFPRRRADAEFLRDALLQISGRLEESHGGNTVPNGTNSEFDFTYSDRHRSVYLPVFRNRLHPMLAVFDFPDPNLVQGKRTNTTLATQALYMMNSSLILELAEETAQQLLTDTGRDRQERVEWLYRSALGRAPSADEQELADRFLNTSKPNDSPEVWTMLTQSLFCSPEFRFID